MVRAVTQEIPKSVCTSQVGKRQGVLWVVDEQNVLRKAMHREGAKCVWLCDPMNCSLPGSSIHGDSPGKNTGVGCHALLQGIFPTQCLFCLIGRQFLYLPLVPPGKPTYREMVKIRPSMTLEHKIKRQEKLEQWADAYSLRRVTVRKLDSFPVGKEEQRIKTADPYHYGCSVQGSTLGDHWTNPG